MEYHTAEEAEKAMKHMDGGQIDGQEISCAPVMRNQGRPPAPIGRGRSPIRGGGRGPPMGGGGRWRSPFRGGGNRFNRRSPIRRRPSPKRRSRSPGRRRRRSNSSRSDSSR